MADTDAYGRSGSGWAERDKDEEDIAAQREWSATKDATVFLIDCSPSMALPVQTTRSEDDSSPSQPPSRGIDLALLLVETALRNACVHMHIAPNLRRRRQLADDDDARV